VHSYTVQSYTVHFILILPGKGSRYHTIQKNVIFCPKYKYDAKIPKIRRKDQSILPLFGHFFGLIAPDEDTCVSRASANKSSTLVQISSLTQQKPEDPSHDCFTICNHVIFWSLGGLGLCTVQGHAVQYSSVCTGKTTHALCKTSESTAVSQVRGSSCKKFCQIE
jgi:hypothetical protein